MAFLKKILLFLSTILLLFACKTKQMAVAVTQDIEKAETPVFQADTNAIPEFPAEVLYVLAREYENIFDAETPKFATDQAKAIRNDSNMTKMAYIEQRLIDFYPTIAYKGVLQKIVSVAEEIIPPKRPKYLGVKSLEQRTAVYSDTQTIDAYVSDEGEMELMSMTAAERQLFGKLNRLADDTTFFDLQKQDSFCINDTAWHLEKRVFAEDQSFFLKENLTIPMLIFGQGSYLFYRVMQSRARAYYAQAYFFPNDTISGTLGDVYKHTFVNALLRRYTTSKIAWLVMDVYWEKRGNNAPCDMVMDLHNNYVGRTTQYHRLVSGENNWEKWANRTFIFVNDTAQNGVRKEWNREMPILFIREDEQNSPNNNYLYWQR